MQTAIDRVLRNIPFWPTGSATENARTEASREEATAFAMRLLDNYKGQLSRTVAPRN